MAYRDAGKDYFQTSDSLATVARKQAKSKNQHGNPIKLPSKLLALHNDPNDSRAVYVAEAAGNIKRVVLETGESTQILHATAPLTSIALLDNTVFAGCWDKQIYAKDLSTGKTTSFTGHSDFVKCLLATTIDRIPLLISGGADATIIVWDLATGQPRYRLKGHPKAVQSLAIYPGSQTGSNTGAQSQRILFSTGSDRDVRRWRITLDQGHELEQSLDKPIRTHETGIWRIVFDSNDDLWTASADKTAQHLVQHHEWQADATLQHPDFVKDIALDEQRGLIITACRDEEVRVWDTATSKLLCVYSGHFEEVTALVLLGSEVISASIDGTIRRWSLVRGDMTKFTEMLQQENDGEEKPDTTVVTTAEEDAELDALMLEED